MAPIGYILISEKINLIYQAFLKLLEFQESLYLIDQDKNWACVIVPHQNQAKRLHQFVIFKNV